MLCQLLLHEAALPAAQLLAELLHLPADLPGAHPTKQQNAVRFEAAKAVQALLVVRLKVIIRCHLMTKTQTHGSFVSQMQRWLLYQNVTGMLASTKTILHF